MAMFRGIYSSGPTSGVQAAMEATAAQRQSLVPNVAPPSTGVYFPEGRTPVKSSSISNLGDQVGGAFEAVIEDGDLLPLIPLLVSASSALPAASEALPAVTGGSSAVGAADALSTDPYALDFSSTVLPSATGSSTGFSSPLGAAAVGAGIAKAADGSTVIPITEGIPQSTDWLDVAGNVAGAIAPVAGAAASYAGQESANAQNLAIAREQMAFQREMSNTAYQRAVGDMSAAGINPMLAYMKGGASTPQGQSAVMQNSAGGAVAAATSLATGLANVRNLMESVNTQRSLQNLQSDQANREYASMKERLSADLLNRAQIKRVNEEAKYIAANAESVRTITRMNEARLPRLENLRDAQQSWWKRNVSPYRRDFETFGNSILRKLPFGGR